jgi:hypothetical protein
MNSVGAAPLKALKSSKCKQHQFGRLILFPSSLVNFANGGNLTHIHHRLT